MNRRAICITEDDARRLRELVENPSLLDHREPESLESLRNELERADIVDSAEIPPDVVTMNSTVRLVDMETGEQEIVSLVFPPDADIDEGRISVLAPVGTAILGYRVGDTFTWAVPGGERQLRVKEVVYQPEAFGDQCTSE